MKKLLLGMMLLLGSLSFASQEDRGTGNHEFNSVNTNVEVSYDGEQYTSTDRQLFGINSIQRN